MEEPTITNEGSGYRVEWPSVGIHVEVRYLKRRIDSFKAECSVYYNNQPIHRSNPTLDSVSGMDWFRRTLQRRMPGEDYNLDWSQIVEDMAGVIIDTARAGTTETVLGDVPESDSVAWRINNLMVEDCTILWADGGTGKSYFALFLATLISEGQEYVNSEHGLLIKPGNVLYLDYETTQSSVASRVRKIHRGLGIERASRIVYRHMELPLAQDVDAIRDICHRRNTDVVFLDSMGLGVAGELESSTEVLDFFRAISAIGKTSLVITHSNRSGTLFGSAYTSNAARSVVEAKKTGGSWGEGSIDFALFHRKANDVELQPAQSWSMKFEGDQVAYTRGDVFQTDAAGSLSYADLVYRILNESAEPRTREYLEETIAGLKDLAVDKVRRNVSTAISRHKTKGRIDETETGLVLAGQQQDGGKGSWTI